MTFKNKRRWLAVLAVLTLALAACSPQKKTPELPTVEPPPLSAIPEVANTPVSPECNPPLPAGTWTGSAMIAAEGFLQNAHYQMPNGGMINVPDARILTQQGQSQLALNVACDGSVSGAANIAAIAQVEYSLAGLFSLIQGQCTAQAESELSGRVEAATDGSGQPRFILTGKVTQGSNQCAWTSGVPGVEDGSFTDDLAGLTVNFQVPVELVGPDEIGGTQWVGSDLQTLVDKYAALLKETARTSGQNVNFDFKVNYNAPWQLQRQP